MSSMKDISCQYKIIEYTMQAPAYQCKSIEYTMQVIAYPYKSLK